MVSQRAPGGPDNSSLIQVQPLRREGAIWWEEGVRKKLRHKKRQNKAASQSQVSNKDPGLETLPIFQAQQLHFVL